MRGRGGQGAGRDAEERQQCEEKAEKDPTLRTAPTVSELYRQYKESKRKSAAAFNREVAAKRAQRFARLGPLVFKGATP